MNKFGMLRCKTVFMLFVILLALSSSAYAQAPLRIAKMDSPDHLLLMRIVSKAYQKLQVPIEFVEYPGRRALLESSAGVVDAELSRVYELGLEYPSLIRVPTSIFWFDASVFSKNQAIKVNGWNSLRGLSIGIMRGMLYAESGLKGFSNVHVLGGSLNLFKFLDAGRVDIVVFSNLNGLYLINKHKFQNIHLLSPGLERIQTYHYVHEKHRALVPKLDAVFQDMKNSGELEEMRKAFVEEISR